MFTKCHFTLVPAVYYSEPIIEPTPTQGRGFIKALEKAPFNHFVRVGSEYS